jgi:hypothetical protein
MTPKIFMILLVLFPVDALGKDPCKPQDYSKAQEPRYDCPSPGEESVMPESPEMKATQPLAKGAAAPHEGLLVDKERFVRFGLRIKGLRRLRWIDTQKHQETVKLEVDYAKKSSKVNLDLAINQRDNYKQQTIAAKKEIERLNKWYHSKIFWASVGAVVAGAAVGVGAWAATR